MPHRLSSGIKLKNASRFNPLNSSPTMARAHVYDKPVVIHEPATKGVGRYKRSRNADI